MTLIERILNRILPAPRMVEVAIAMQDDQGNRAPSLAVVMLERDYMTLAEDWRSAVYTTFRQAGNYDMRRGGKFVNVGLIVSNILALTAVPIVSVDDNSQGDV
jgi:hypothetical protein